MKTPIFLCFLLVSCLCIWCQEDVELSIQASELIEQVDNAAVKNMLQKKLEKILANPDDNQKIQDLQQFIISVKRTIGQNKTDQSTSANRYSPPTPLSKPKTINVEKEIELHNMLMEYACLLNDLEGKGVDVVRDQLQNNLDVSDLSPEARKLLESMIFICSQAETSLKELGYLTEDRDQEQNKTKWQTGVKVGMSIVKAIATENPFALIEGVSAIGSGISEHKKIGEKAQIRLDMVLQNYKANLDRFFYDLNQYRSQLVYVYHVEITQFFTKNLYLQFKQAILDKDINAKITLLKMICLQCPNFRDAHYYLYRAYIEKKDENLAQQTLLECAKYPSQLIRKDMYLVYIYGPLSYYSLSTAQADVALDYCNKALEIDPTYPIAYHNRSIAYMHLGQKEKALQDSEKALELEPSADFPWWGKARILAKCFEQEDKALTALRIAIHKGFADFARIRASEELQHALATPRGKWIITPKLYAVYTPGTFNDDVMIYNTAPYFLTNIQLNIQVDYDLDAKTPSAKKADKKIDSLSSMDQNGYGIKFKNIFDIPNKFKQKRIILTYTCDQHPEPVEVCLVNYLNPKEYTTFDYYLWKKCWELYEKNTDEDYQKAYQLAQQHLLLSPDEAGYYLCCKTSYALKKMDEAEQYADQSLAMSGEELAFIKYTKPNEETESRIHARAKASFFIKQSAVNERVWNAYHTENAALIRSGDLDWLIQSEDKNHFDTLAAYYAWQKDVAKANEYAAQALPETPRRVELLMQGMNPQAVEKLMSVIKK